MLNTVTKAASNTGWPRFRVVSHQQTCQELVVLRFGHPWSIVTAQRRDLYVQDRLSLMSLADIGLVDSTSGQQWCT